MCIQRSIERASRNGFDDESVGAVLANAEVEHINFQTVVNSVRNLIAMQPYIELIKEVQNTGDIQKKTFLFQYSITADDEVQYENKAFDLFFMIDDLTDPDLTIYKEINRFTLCTEYTFDENTIKIIIMYKNV